MLLGLLALGLSDAHAAESDLAPGFTVILPLGVPQLAEGRTRRGLIYGGLQLAGLGLTTTALVQMRSLAVSGNDIEAELRWRMVSAGSTAFTAGSWFASTLDASRYRQVQIEEMQAALMAWDAARASRG